jgi:hypothetical protein
MKMKFFPAYEDEGEGVTAWGQAQLIKCRDGKLELKGGSREESPGCIRMDLAVFGMRRWWEREGA